MIVLSVLLLVIAIFALENALPVIAELFKVVSRLRHWNRGRAATSAVRPGKLPAESRTPGDRFFHRAR